MKIKALAVRTAKEILRDPLSILFGLGFPLVLLALLTAIQAHVPVELFSLEKLTPGITIFGLSFIALFSATLISKDRESALLERLYTAPLTAWDFLAGYALPLVPFSLAQCLVCYLAAFLLGLPFSGSVFLAAALILLPALFFIGLGLLCGSVLKVKQVGGVCGALLTNLTAWLSGVWFDLRLVGGAFEKIAGFLPFVHAVEMERAALAGDLMGIFPHIWWVAGYAAAAFAAASALFCRQMRRL